MTGRRARRSSSAFTALPAAAGALFLLFLILPMASLLVHAPPRDLVRQLGTPVVVQALRLSLITTCASTLAVLILTGEVRLGFAP